MFIISSVAAMRMSETKIVTPKPNSKLVLIFMFLSIDNSSSLPF